VTATIRVLPAATASVATTVAAVVAMKVATAIANVLTTVFLLRRSPPCVANPRAAEWMACQLLRYVRGGVSGGGCDKQQRPDGDRGVPKRPMLVLMAMLEHGDAGSHGCADSTYARS
jgi:hypothetical protein